MTDGPLQVNMVRENCLELRVGAKDPEVAPAARVMVYDLIMEVGVNQKRLLTKEVAICERCV